MSIKERRANEIANMKSAILEAAMELILDQGFENVSIRKIAERIHYSPATIYLYFKDKQDILHHLHTEGFRRFAEAQKGLEDIADPAVRMYKHGMVYIRFALANPEYYQLMFILKGTAKQYARTDEPDGSRETYEVLRNNLRLYQEQGNLQGINLDHLAFLFWSTVHGMASLLISERLNITKEQAEQFVHGAFEALRELYSDPR